MKKTLLFLMLLCGTLAIAQARPVEHHGSGPGDNPTITVPEPAEYMLVGMAVLGLAGAIARKFKAKA